MIPSYFSWYRQFVLFRFEPIPSFFFFLQISRNITTNEMANALRCSYLRSPRVRFRNPYDHGYKNFSDFMINGYNVDMEYTEEYDRSEGIRMMQMVRNHSLPNRVNYTHHIMEMAIMIIEMNTNMSAETQGQVHSPLGCHSSNPSGKTNTFSKNLGIDWGQNAILSVPVSWNTLLCTQYCLKVHMRFSFCNTLVACSV